MIRSLLLRTTFGAAALMLVAGCATTGANKPYSPSRPDESRALQLVKSVDLVGLRDAEAPQGATAPTPGDLSLPAGVAFGALNYLSPPPGFSSGMAGALGFASFFLSGPSAEEASTHPYILVWMPRDMAASRDEAAVKIDGIVQAALADVMAETVLPAPYSMTRVPPAAAGERRAIDDFHSRAPAFRISGGICSEEDVRCGYQAVMLAKPQAVTAPSLLGGGDAWGFVRTGGMLGLAPSALDRRTTFQIRRHSLFPDMAVYRKLSQRLPDWMAIYVPPNRVAYVNEEGTLQFVPFPLVLRSGEPLYFVKGH